MKKTIALAAVIIVVATVPANAGSYWQTGNIVNYTAIQGGLMVMLDTGIPDNCAGTPFNWMIIHEEDKAMLAMAFMRISQGQMGVTLYSNGTSPLGYCRVTQYDPAE